MLEGNTMTNARDKALELVEDGMVSAEDMLTMCLKYMSTDDVADMLDSNELSDRFLEDEDDYEDDGQPSWEQEWEDFGEVYE
jgi:threonine dehydrogenase-like Zn-dependent dehydrogenase